MSHIYASLRSTLASRRTTARAHRELAREISQFDTPGARLELEAILDRHSEEEGRAVRSILRSQQAKAA